MLLEPDERMQAQPQDRLGVRLRDLLDLDAALGGRDHRDRAGCPVEDEAQVVLVRDVGSRRDEHGLDRGALDVEADDLASTVRRLVRRRRQLDAAGLSATADEDLRLHDNRRADVGRGRPRLLWGRRDRAGQMRHAMAGEDLDGPILLELHSPLLPVMDTGARRFGARTRGTRSIVAIRPAIMLQPRGRSR